MGDFQSMDYKAKLAIFPPGQAPFPYEIIDGTFSSISEAAKAAEDALKPIAQREIAELAARCRPAPNREGGIAATRVPNVKVHGFLIFDAQEIQVSSWTTLDEAARRVAEG